MRARSLNVFAGVLMFGLLLGASSTAYADAFSLTSFGFSNFQFTPSAGTAQFTVTATTARADSGNGTTQVINTSNSFPFAQTTAIVSGATAAGTADGNTVSVSGTTTAFLSGCSCASGSLGQGTLTGTLVLSGADGPVTVTISALETLIWQVQTDVFGRYAESGTFFDLFVNGTPVFSFEVEALHPLLGPNQSSMLNAVFQMSRTITLQGGSTNTIFMRLNATSLVINEVPEPASVVLLLSGLGAVAGVLKSRRRPADR
jgi:PEP-CTERM motif-containing protein